MPGAFEHVQLAWQYPKLRAWVEGLSARFQLIQFDERGAGMSTRGLKETHVVEDYQRDLEAVVEYLKPEAFVLQAAATRTTTAVQFAVDHPDRIYALVLSPGRLAQVSSETQSAFFNTLPEANWELFLRSLASQYQAPEDIPLSMALFSQAFEQHDFAHRMRVALTGLPEELVSRLDVPTLVLHPRDYWGGPPSHDASMRVAQLARGSVTLIDGSFALGDAEQGIRAIEGFLSGLPLTQSVKPPHSDAGLSDSEIEFLRFPAAGSARLSPRETEVLRLIAAGKSNQQIADTLVLSLRTVERHITNLYGKIGAHGKADATAYALRHGFDKPERG
jgi:DNA-binding CsgD family transcriptional regulator/pimeloyl-ACP methyl ester carboxylesterase